MLPARLTPPTPLSVWHLRSERRVCLVFVEADPPTAGWPRTLWQASDDGSSIGHAERDGYGMLSWSETIAWQSERLVVRRWRDATW